MCICPSWWTTAAEQQRKLEHFSNSLPPKGTSLQKLTVWMITVFKIMVCSKVFSKSKKSFTESLNSWWPEFSEDPSAALSRLIGTNLPQNSHIFALAFHTLLFKLWYYASILYHPSSAQYLNTSHIQTGREYKLHLILCLFCTLG